MKISNSQSGVTLVEVLVSVFLLSVVSISLYGMFLLAGRLVADAKLRLMGTYAANEEMENLKSMAYNQVGTVGGVPDGIIPQSKTVEKGGYAFDVATEVRFGDDPVDNLFPADTVPTDYKVARVTVSWPSAFKNHEIVLISSVYPDVPEEDENGGILSVNAIDFEGNGVPNCDVLIENTSVTPQVSIHTSTDDQGNVMLLGIPPSDEYKITLSKASFETVETFPPYPTTPYQPVDENASVVEGWLNMKAIQIDETGLIQISVVDEADLPRSSFGLDINGGRVLGYTVGTEREPVYAYNEINKTTDGNGALSISSAGHGSYSVESHSTEYELVGTDAGNPFDVPVGGTVPVKITAVNKTTDSILVRVMDSATRDPIPDASVTVSGEGFSATQLSDPNGNAFFWQEGMVEQDYSIAIDAEGYSSYSGAVQLSELTHADSYMQSN